MDSSKTRGLEEQQVVLPFQMIVEVFLREKSGFRSNSQRFQVRLWVLQTSVLTAIRWIFRRLWQRRRRGFSLHANVKIECKDRDKLEYLCRYEARPPVSLERLSETGFGQIS